MLLYAMPYMKGPAYQPAGPGPCKLVARQMMRLWCANKAYVGNVQAWRP